jgi:Cap4, dsDNA endonuclease domain/AAA domain
MRGFFEDGTLAGSEAQAGFYYQNIVAALYLLELIEIGSPLRTVVLENPDRAQYIDDIIAEGTNKTTFVQVKWSQEDTAAFTLHNLVTPDDGTSMPLIAKLARGFRQVESEEGRKEVVLLSTNAPGVNSQPMKGFTKSLVEFIDEFHRPFITDYEADDIRRVPSFPKYESVLKRLALGAGLPDLDDFARFLKSFRFKLGQPDRDTMIARVHAQLSQLGIERAQYAVLLDQVVRWSIEKRRITAQDVLLALGLRDRFLDQVTHSFPVDRKLWIPTPDLFDELEAAVGALTDGFIFVEGQPGIGKSTALAMYQESHKDVSFGYFCFIPTERVLGNARLEQDAFVRSLCIGLRNAFSDIAFPHPYAQLNKTTLNNWLHTLSQHGRKAVFIVDGLDHVDYKQREGLISEPLTSVLDGGLPSGVLIILSSQYLEALPKKIRAHVLSDPKRRYLRMNRFKQPQIEEFFVRRGVRLRPETMLLAGAISGGIPVYLEYLADRLGDLTSYEQTRFLEGVPNLRNDRIDSYHSHIWASLSGDQQTIYVLAILAARWDLTTPSELLELLHLLGLSSTLLSVLTSIERVKHVLRKSEAQGFAIRHNSFREFVFGETSALQAEISQVLVTWYAENPDRDEAWRHRFRHLFELQKYTELLLTCNDEWLDRSWRDYRPIREISRNLDIVWQAASFTLDLTEFVRIALLSQRMGLVAKNLDLSEADVACFLLDIGLPQQALRRVWDGEKVNCDSLAFAKFCLHHKHCIGRMPPVQMMKVGLTESPAGASPEALEVYWRACRYTQDPVMVLGEISRTKWIHKSEYDHRVNRITETKAEETNKSIQMAVVQEIDNVIDLVHIWNTPHPIDSSVRNYARGMTALLFARVGDAEEAKKHLKAVDLVGIPERPRLELLLKFAPYGLWDSSWKQWIVVPDLPEFFLHPGETQLPPSLFMLYDRLRVFFLADETGFPWLESALTAGAGGVKSLTLALGRLARLWCDWATGRKGAFRTELSELKAIANSLNLREASFGDSDNDDYYSRHLYLQHSWQFLKHVWAAAAEVLTPSELLSFCGWWANSEDGLRARKYAKATRELAVTLHGHLAESAQETAMTLLNLAEQSAREDEETSVIVSELLASASAWGRCGLFEQASRIWNELLNIACGVYYRKDYQFNEILTPLKLAHEQNPNSTIQRVAEQLRFAHQLEGAARSKTTSIAIEELTAFVASFEPGLSLRILDKEEPSIFRARALQGVVAELLARGDIGLRWLWALTLTIGRWENHTDYSEHARPTMRAIYNASLERGDHQIAKRVYDDARNIFLVEKEDIDELTHWAQLWANSGREPSEVAADLGRFVREANPQTSNEKQKPFFDEEEYELAAQAAKIGLPQLESYLDLLQSDAVIEARHRELEQVHEEWLAVLTALVGHQLSEEESHAVNDCFHVLQQEAATIPLHPRLQAAETTEVLLAQFLSSVNVLLHTRITLKQFLELFDFQKWLERFLHPGPSRYHQERVLEEGLQRWIQESAVEDLHEWEEFCSLRCAGKCKSLGLSSIAKRLAKTDPAHASDLLSQAWRDYEFFWFDVSLAREICSEAFALDQAKGKLLLLESFRRYFERFPETIIYSLDNVFRFSNEFSPVDYDRLYVIWSSYNKRLAAGLSAKPTNLDWLADTALGGFPAECVRYLLSLFDYPVVDVRRLALVEIYKLVKEAIVSVETILEEWDSLTANQKEHVTSLLFSIALDQPASLSRWGRHIIELAQREKHFNIRRTVSEMIIAASALDANANPELIDSARSLGSSPRVIMPLNPCVGIDGEDTPCLPYQRWVLKRLERVIPDDTLSLRVRSLTARRYPDLQAGWSDEQHIHRSYNINTNFDVIELGGPYQRAVQEAINQSLHDFVQAHTLKDADLTDAANILRLYDPTDLSILRVSRPTRVNWIDGTIAEKSYLAFEDWGDLKKRLFGRDETWLTIYEHCEQRLGDRTGADNARATRVHLRVFGIRHTDFALTEETAKQNWGDGRNRHRFELKEPLQGLSTIAAVFVPLVHVSHNATRGRHHLDTAGILPNLVKGLHLRAVEGDWLGYEFDGQLSVRSIEWQEEFDQGRRRHEPRSSGFLLEINRLMLLDWVQKNGLSLAVELEIDRTTDKYKPEREMEWVTRHEVFLFPA